jgi:ATP synthase protein I
VESPEQENSEGVSIEEKPPAEQSDLKPIDSGMNEYQQLKRELLIAIVALSIALFALVWLKFGLNTALNYLLGAATGLVYLRMLAREVESVSGAKTKLNSNRLGLVAGVIILAAKVPELKILPVFLGFLTYKIALLIYAVRWASAPTDEKSSHNVDSAESPSDL